VDTTKTTHISLCAGYGGIDLGLRGAIPNLRTVAFSEIEAFACANLVSKMEAGLLDPAPIWTNLKTFPWESFRGKVDILSGGYPCQPFSSAGKRLGKEDPRHLWPYIADGIRILQPALCFFENVEGHITLGLRDVLHDLGGLGYRTSWGIFSASEVGAPHQRKRVFILAHRADLGGQVRYIAGSQGAGETGDAVPRCEEVAHRKCAGLEGWVRSMQPESIGRRASDQPSEGGDLLVNPVNYGGGDVRGSKRLEAQQPVASVSSSSVQWWPSGPGQPQFGWEPPRVAQSALGRNADGSAGGMDYAQLCVAGDNRVDELRLLGNGVVPATATRAFLTLIKEL
jgi:DNA (cytosine-5)-methyltransferase 1